MNTKAKLHGREEKADRRERRKEERQRGRRNRMDEAVGGLESPKSFRRLLLQMSQPQSFEDVRDALIPMLPRRNPPPDFGQVPVTTILPPGIPVGFAVDSEHAYGTVLTDVLGEWGVDARTIAMTAISNLRRRAEARDPRDIQEVKFGDLAARALRPTEGWESALILAPDLLERFFGSEPIYVASPLRPLLLAFDGDEDPIQVAGVVEMLASSDPRGLAIDPMRFENGQLAVIRWPFGDEMEATSEAPPRPRPS